MTKNFPFIPLKILLPFILIWYLYLIQSNPEAEEFFHGDSDKYIKSSEIKGGNDVQRLIDHRPRRSLVELIEEANQATTDEDLAKKNLTLDDPDDSFFCWLNSRLEPINDTSTCASVNEIQNILLKNQELLKQYKALIHYPGKVSDIASNSVLDGLRLLLANLHLMAIQGNSRDALDLWITNFSYWKKIYTSEPLNWLYKAILHVVYSQSIEILPAIINNLKEFSESEYQHLIELLQPIEPENWNLEETIREEYLDTENMIVENLDKYPFLIKLNNRLMVKYYKEAQDFLTRAKLPSDQYCVMGYDRKSRPPEATKFQSIINILRYGPYGSLSMFSSPASVRHLMLVGSMHTLNTRMSLASLFVKIKHQSILSSDIGIFIEKNLNIYRDPRNNKPFKYNEKENKLFFKSFENCKDAHEIYLAPPTFSAKIQL
ncbi:MAG: hypothetical protein AB8D52_06780 [Gammaproteobacteria bacterium]